MTRRWQVVEFDRLRCYYVLGIYDSFHAALMAKWRAHWVRPYRPMIVVLPYEKHPDVVKRDAETSQWLARMRQAVAR